MKTYRLTRTMHPAGTEPYNQELLLQAESEAELFDAYLDRLFAENIDGMTGKPIEAAIIECSASLPSGDCLLAEDAFTEDGQDFTSSASDELRRYFDEYEIT